MKGSKVAEKRGQSVFFFALVKKKKTYLQEYRLGRRLPS